MTFTDRPSPKDFLAQQATCSRRSPVRYPTHHAKPETSVPPAANLYVRDPCRTRVNESVLLLFLRHLFPDWEFSLDHHGMWRAKGRILISSSCAESLISCLAIAAPDAYSRALSVLKDSAD